MIRDSRLHLPIGGFGGLHRHAPLHHTPVVFVHGNQADAQNWLAPMLQFQRLAGYSMQEMYAISYNGLGNFYAGEPTTAPTLPDQDYFQQNPDGFGNGGHGAANDDEVPDLCRFVEAVQKYTGSRHVDIVAHSLGVTIGRKLMVDYPALARDVTAFVAVAGANHGTSVCRGLDTSYYGCNEIAPGTAWLKALNSHGESPAPTRWMTVYNGASGDPFFDPPYDESSPHLAGALNRAYAGQYHNDLRAEPTEVDDYLAFLLRVGQAGGATQRERHIARTLTRRHPDGRNGELCGIKKLTGC
jgi:pimeloyl-ACP methyl ester carboxylesterase